jgi:hypothetical protein
MKIKGIILGGQEAWKAADDLKKNNIAVIYTNIYNLPVRDDDAYDYLFEAPGENAASGRQILHLDRQRRRGSSRFAVSRRTGRRLRFAERRSLKSVTLYPAQILGIADRSARSKPEKSPTSSSPTAIF